VSFTETLKNLLIPRKTQKPVQQPDYGTDMRAIENWVSGDLMGFLDDLITYVNGITPGTGYVSLTGPGETMSPGALTQEGAFTINGTLNVTAEDGDINLTAESGSVGIEASTDITLEINDPGDNGAISLIAILPDSRTAALVLDYLGNLTSEDSILNDIQLFGAGNVGLVGAVGCGITCNGVDANSSISLDEFGGVTVTTGTSGSDGWFLVQNQLLGFFSVPPVAQISGSGITTVAELVSALQSYGILGT
jgi:hypothetical protein